jgi:hypothetical protein
MFDDTHHLASFQRLGWQSFIIRYLALFLMCFKRVSSGIHDTEGSQATVLPTQLLVGCTGVVGVVGCTAVVVVVVGCTAVVVVVVFGAANGNACRDRATRTLADHALELALASASAARISNCTRD